MGACVFSDAVMAQNFYVLIMVKMALAKRQRPFLCQCVTGLTNAEAVVPSARDTVHVDTGKSDREA